MRLVSGAEKWRQVRGENDEEQNPGAGGRDGLYDWCFPGLWPIWAHPNQAAKYREHFSSGGWWRRGVRGNQQDRGKVAAGVVDRWQRDDRSTARVLDGNGALEKRFDGIN